LAEISATIHGMTSKQPKRRRDMTVASKTGRSRVTNGADLLPHSDGRTAASRRYRDIYAQVCSDKGSADRMSEIQLHLARTFATVSVKAEEIAAQLVNGNPVDIEVLCRLAATQVKLATRLGLGRAARQVETLQSYLANRAAEQNANATDDDSNDQDANVIDMEAAE
jgi:hypothetical protein